MKLLPKFALYAIGVAAMPLAIFGYSSTRTSQRALRAAIEEQEAMVATQVAEYVTAHLGNLHATLRLEPRILDVTRAGKTVPSAEVLRGFLRLVYLQHEDFSAVALLDPKGKFLVAPVFQNAPKPNTALGRHEAAAEPDAVALARATPLAEAVRNDIAVGPVILAGVNDTPHLVLAIRYPSMANDEERIISAAVSMRRLQHYLAGVATDREVFLVDRQSRLVASGRAVGPTHLEPKRIGRAPAGALPDRSFVDEYDTAERRVIGAYIPVPTFGLGVVVERPIEAALSPLETLKLTTVYWMGISALIAAVVGAALARTLSARAGTLAAGARRIAQGKLDIQLEVRSNDELGELARAFNAMATSLDAARTEILRQTDEIMAWNETLERRVDEKTKELRDAHDLLLRSRSLAAIGSLGAGVAHEINNPLTGVLGLAQLLLSDLPEDHPSRPMVRDIEEQAQRIEQIVSNLLRLAQKQSGEDFRPLDLAKVLDDALELCGPKALADGGVQLVRRVVSPLPLVRGSGVQLQAALIQLIQNARGAMENGGVLTIETTLPEPGLLRIRISDTGRGIKPEHLSRIFDPFFTTKARRTDTGVGLSVVHKIVEDHGGTVRVESGPSQGTTFTLSFPIDAGTHLA